MDTECIISHIECGEILLGVYIHSDVNLYGVWRYSTLHNIHMDTNMDMDMECIMNHMECGEILQPIISIQNLLTDENRYL